MAEFKNPYSSGGEFKNPYTGGGTFTNPYTARNGFQNPYSNALSNSSSAYDLKTSEGLYDLASGLGLQDKANKALEEQSGEDNSFFSGGIISDIFDVMNVAQYGVVGVLKGGTFADGIKNRESFADEDSLGSGGLIGKIFGTVLDIAVDPFTYLSPYMLAKKIPLFGKGLQVAEGAFFGKKVAKTIETAKGVEKTFDTLEGGTKVGKFLGEKFGWMFGADPIFRQTYERNMVNQMLGAKKAAELIKPIATLDNKVASLLLKVDPDDANRFIRRGMDEIVPDLLKKGVDKDTIKGVKKAFDTLDGLSKDAVKLGLISKEQFEKTFGLYIKNAYKEYEENIVKKGIQKIGKVGIKGKGRLDIDDVRKLDVTQIDNPAYLMYKSMADLSSDIENAKMFKLVSDKYGTDIAQEGFSQIPKTARFTTTGGAQSSILEQIGETNKNLKPMLKDLKNVFKDDKKLLSKISGMEKSIEEMGTKQGDKLSEYMSEIVHKISKTETKVYKIAEPLQKHANTVKKFLGKGKNKTFKQFYASDAGIKMVKDYEEGLFEDFGFKSLDEFFDAVKNGVKEGVQTGDDLVDMNKAISFVTKSLDNGLPDKKAVVKLIEDNFPNAALKDDFLNAVADVGDSKPVAQVVDELKVIFEKMAGDIELNRGGKLLKEAKDLRSAISKKKLDKTFLKELDKPSINDAFINLEEGINNLVFKKQGLTEDLGFLKAGDLAGKYVPDQMHKYLMEVIEPAKDKVGQKVMNEFKFFKVVMNPATHARNIVSNKILNWWKLGMNPLDPRVISSDAGAAKEIFNKGGKWIDEATEYGYGLNTFMSQEVKTLLNSPEMTKLSKGVSGWNKTKSSLGEIYQGEENMAKLSAFIFNRNKGLGAEEAWKAAESATFNYAQVTPFIRTLRQSLFGMPFITFTTKATPVAIETALKHPNRIGAIGKIKNTIEKISDVKTTARERAAEPSWVKDGFYVKLPFKDKHDRSAYFDLTYILPFGDLVSGNFLERNQDMSTGMKKNLAKSAANKFPFFQLVSQLTSNKDFYGNKIVKDSDDIRKQSSDILRHISKTYLPPMVSDQIPGGYDDKGERQYRGIAGSLKASDENSKRTLVQEMLRNIGAKIQPINVDKQEMYQEWNKKKALQTMLSESGGGKTFEIFGANKDE